MNRPVAVKRKVSNQARITQPRARIRLSGRIKPSEMTRNMPRVVALKISEYSRVPPSRFRVLYSPIPAKIMIQIMRMKDIKS